MRGSRRAWVVAMCVAGAGGVFAACGSRLNQGPMPPDGGARAAPPPGDAGGDLVAPERDGGATGAGTADAATERDATAAPDASSRHTASVCPFVDSPAVAPIAAAPAHVATALPVSCNPLSRRFLFPPPLAGTPGLYSRCGTFSLGAVQALALSVDGRLAAMVNGDGIARIVEIASQRVVAVLAPPRARVSRVAFSPDGRSIATVAGQQHEVTLYRTDLWRPVWTTTLPGTLYGYMDGGGAIAFSPDSQAIAVSPGTNLYLLDATGAVQATYPSPAILDVAYAWGGRRLVAADASLTGSCTKRPDGGAIVVLDPGSLAKLATIASWAGYAEDDVTPAFRASPTDDLVFVPPSTHDAVQTIHAFRVSDGGELARPASTTLPVAFLPNGGLVTGASGTLTVQLPTGATGTVTAPTAAATAYAVSGDGSAVAIGGDGADLLHVWNTGDDSMLGVCTLDDTQPGPMTLSGDGRVAAIGVGGRVQVFRPDDGTPIAALNGNGEPFQRLTLSPTGRFIAVVEYQASVPVQDLPEPLVDFLQIISIPGNGEVADLSRKNAFHGGYLFSPDEATFYDTYFPDGGASPGTLETVDLATGKVIAARGGLPSGTRPIGFSRGCPVLLDPSRGAYRSCDACDEAPVAASGASIVSPDGTAVLTADGYPALTSTLWSLPEDQKLQVFARPAGDEVGPDSLVSAWPVASAAGGAQVLIGAGDGEACYDGPSFQTLLEDASGNILDALPPGGAPASDDLARLLYGTELWCRR